MSELMFTFRYLTCNKMKINYYDYKQLAVCKSLKCKYQYNGSKYVELDARD